MQGGQTAAAAAAALWPPPPPAAAAITLSAATNAAANAATPAAETGPSGAGSRVGRAGSVATTPTGNAASTSKEPWRVRRRLLNASAAHSGL